MEQPKRYPEMDGAGRNTLAAFVMRGPLVLAKASRLGLCEKEIFTAETVNGDTAWKVTAKPLAPVDGFWGVWELTLEKGFHKNGSQMPRIRKSHHAKTWWLKLFLR